MKPNSVTSSISLVSRGSCKSLLSLESKRRPISWGNLISCFEESRREGRDQCSHLGKIQSAHMICLLTFLLVSPSASKVTCTCKKKKVNKVQIYPSEWVSSPLSLSQLLPVERNTIACRCLLCTWHTYRQRVRAHHSRRPAACWFYSLCDRQSSGSMHRNRPT